MEKNTVLSKLKLIGFILYFLILFAERLLAVILSPAVGGEYALVSGNVFNYIAYAVTALSVVAGLVLMIRVLPKMFVSVFTRKAYDFDANRKSVILAATVILFGGMMHTGFTIAPIQFVSYGFLIAAMVVRTIECCREGKRLAAEKDELTAGKFRLRSYASVVSVIYLTLFAMAVPVSYISFQEMPLRAVFFAVEFTTVFVLVPVFGLLMLRFFESGVTSFSFVYPVIILLFSGATVALKWREEINWFVLIFLILTLVFYLSFGLIARAKVKRLVTEEKLSSE